MTWEQSDLYLDNHYAEFVVHKTRVKNVYRIVAILHYEVIRFAHVKEYHVNPQILIKVRKYILFIDYKLYSLMMFDYR